MDALRLGSGDFTVEGRGEYVSGYIVTQRSSDQREPDDRLYFKDKKELEKLVKLIQKFLELEENLKLGY